MKSLGYWIVKRIWDRKLNAQRDVAVKRGEFLYYIVSGDTNIRNRSDDGEIVIYSSRDAAEEVYEWTEDVISVAEYNRIFGRFAEKK